MVRDAIVLAGGRGTRMLPASLYSPKETLPLVDTPILNHIVWEAERAGVDRLHLVLSPIKYKSLESFFSNGIGSFEGVRPDLPREALSLGTSRVKVFPHVQDKPGGVGDAIATAIHAVDGPFLVILGDMLLMQNYQGHDEMGPKFASMASKKLVTTFEETGLPCVGVIPVSYDEVGNYGIVEVTDDLVVDIIEKPLPSEVVSNLILCGRYIFPEDTKELLRDYPLSIHGEMQSIEILKHFSRNEGLVAVDLGSMVAYDSGDPLTWLKAQVDHALRRGDLSDDFTKWLKDTLSRI